MIIVRLEGGLGNQMFQYALGRHLSIINNTELKIELSAFDKNSYSNKTTYRGFQLTAFKLNYKVANKGDIQSVKNSIPDFSERLKYRLMRLKTTPYYRKNEIYETTVFRFDENILKVGKNTYLVGYWQSSFYFNAIRKQLLEDFQFSDIPTEKEYPFIKKLNTQNAISVHIRRGDYVSNPEYLKIHGLCSVEYYQKAIEYICSRVQNPIFYFFSDDIKWVEHNLKISHSSVYVTETPLGKDYYELYLMSLCKHNIIANSSFSWWGAWLNQNKQKIVIAPAKWMNNIETDTKDLIPTELIQL
jgi:hypothetical protein